MGVCPAAFVNYRARDLSILYFSVTAMYYYVSDLSIYVPCFRVSLKLLA